MRKITETIVTAFLARKPRYISNSTTDGRVLFLHGNAIAWHGVHDGVQGVYMTLCGWGSPTTRERLKGVLKAMGQKRQEGCIGFFQRKGEQFLGSHTWGEFEAKPQDRALSANEVVFVADARHAAGLAAVTFELVPGTGRTQEVSS